VSHLTILALNPVGVLMVLVGLGGLVFFHELGHFLACRVTGTRVEVFSVGFGPTIWGWKRGHTFYRIAAIPLGGYVKMAAENPGDKGTGASDELPRKSFSQRLLIFTAGVIFNVFLAFVLFAWAFGIGIPFTRPEISGVEPGEAAWAAGIQRGDLVTHINGEPVLSFDDLRTAIAFSSEDETVDLTVDRGGKTLQFSLMPRYSEELGFPIIGAKPAYDLEARAVEDDSPVARAGGLAGDRVTKVNGTRLEGPLTFVSVGEALRDTPAGQKQTSVTLEIERAGQKKTLELTIPVKAVPVLGVVPYESNIVDSVRTNSLLRARDVLQSVNGKEVRDIGAFKRAGGAELVTSILIGRNGKETELEPGAAITVAALGASISARPRTDSTKIYPLEGGSAARAGLEPGDVITKLGQEEISDWDEMRDAIRAHAGPGPLAVEIKRRGETKTVQITPGRRNEYRDADTHPSLGYVFVQQWEEHREPNIVKAMGMGVDRTFFFMRSVFLTIRGLVTSRVSARNIGGPIMLAEFSYKMWDLGFARYLYILALISINLAVLNILPIPVLDGGQVVFLIAEKVRGKPLSERVIGIFQVVGLVFILGLMVLAFTNDITRLLS
jgi:regulator of sigma E protease